MPVPVSFPISRGMAELVIRRGLEEPDTSDKFVPHKPARPEKSMGGRRFELADFVRVDKADLADGLLVIDLVREVPEAMKPKKIHVGGQPSLEVVKDGGDDPGKADAA